MSKCPNKITEECKDCGSHCYCDRWKGYQQGRDDAYDHAMTILNGLDTELAELFSDIWLDEIKEENNGNTSN